MASPTRSASLRSWVTKIAVIAYRAATRLKRRLHLGAGLDVEAAERLVEEQERRARRSAPDRTTRAASALPKAGGAPCRAGREGRGSRACGPRLPGFGPSGRGAGGDRRPRSRRRSGAGRAAAPGRGRRRRAARPAPGRCRRHGGGSLRRRARGGRPEQLEERRLAAARSPQDAERLALRQGEAHVLEDRLGPKDFERPRTSRNGGGAVMRVPRMARRLIHERTRGGRTRRTLATAA